MTAFDAQAIRERFEATRNLRGEDGEESDGDELTCEDCQEEIRIDSESTMVDPNDVLVCHGCEKERLRRSVEDVPVLLERIAELTAKAKAGKRKPR
jgi:hypothetical protein